MRILFLLGAASRIRNFDHTIATLADHGHSVRLTGRLRKGSFELPPDLQREGVSGQVNPTERVDEWRDLVDLLRGARDYVRYFDPRYAQATRLVRRAYEIAPTDFVLFCERHTWVKQRWSAVSKALAICEEVIPTDPGFEAFVRDANPDLVVVTPLVTFESYQTDYVKAAHRLGIPVVFIPFSWDNLTNKGLMRIHPDLTLVWNEVQRKEAIELHGCSPDSVVITGAARFDDFFARSVSSARDEFLSRHNLDPTRPLVLYLGSSQLTGPNEMELVRQWAEAMRRSPADRVRNAAILIRPHPALAESWTALDFADLGQVAISPGSSRGADQDLFDSLWHSHVAVGLNTSAMLEAAIVGRPVHTLMIPGFDEGQTGTMHFRYLVEAFGGLATVAGSFDEHVAQLAGVLAGEPILSSRSRAFAEQFLRPHGIDRPVSPILAAEIERGGTIRRPPQAATPLWHRPARTLIRRVFGRSGTARKVVEDTTIVATSMSLRAVRTALEEMQQGNVPVLVGPWADSVGKELMFWLPFVRWATATYGLAPEKLVAISRDGVGDWYRPLARRYLDGPALFSASELEYWTRRTVPQSQQNPKQAVMSPFDREIVERAARALDLSDYQVLHPMLLFRVLLRLRKDRGWPQLDEVLKHERIEAGERVLPAALPERFVAVSAGFTDALPDTPENRAFMNGLIEEVASRATVLMVDAPGPAHLELSSRVRRLEEFVGAGEQPLLRTQSAAIARADMFLGAYGDLTVLAANLGKAVTAYHSERLPIELAEGLRVASASGTWGHVVVERARPGKGVRFPAKLRREPQEVGVER